jgi:DNA-binding LacI/PurR family transcriptional regulator
VAQPDNSPLIQPEPDWSNPERWPTGDVLESVLNELAAAKVTAVLIHGDRMALALIQQARIRGWHIPNDLSVIAYDDEHSEMADPPLTAIAPPRTWLARTATELLLELISGDHSAPVREIVAQPRLVVRSSVDGPRGARGS